MWMLATRLSGRPRNSRRRLGSIPALATDLTVIGKPLVSVVAFTSSSLNVYDLVDGMEGRGWHLNALQNPPAIHVAFTLPIVAALERLIRDLVEAVEGEREKERVRVAEGRGKRGAASGKTAALYGAGLLPDKSIVVQLAGGFLDTLYKA